MNRFLLAVAILLASLGSNSLAAPTAKAPAAKAPASKTVRTIRTLPGFPMEALKQTVSAKFYRSLLVSPVDGWIVVKGQLVHGKFAGARVTHSELGGAFDNVAVDLAKSFTITGFGGTDRQMQAMGIAMHLVVYRIADGTMVIGVPTSDEAGGNQMNYYGSAFMAVHQGGKWTQIKGPELRRR